MSFKDEDENNFLSLVKKMSGKRIIDNLVSRSKAAKDLFSE
jgi:hypothetical protein